MAHDYSSLLVNHPVLERITFRFNSSRLALPIVAPKKTEQ